jgi:hypothetical protein
MTVVAAHALAIAYFATLFTSAHWLLFGWRWP